MQAAKYRSDIDGLRALAIIPVVLYHLDLAFFSGGFVGVDIFFVISGFLITSILVKEMQQDRFSLINFYERRARRILPALFVVIIFVLLTAPFFLAPNEYSFLPIEVLGVLVFCSNIISWMKSGYFSADSEERPLLHMWSLGVEEQFYIVLPILLLISLYLFKKKYGIAILIITLVSLFTSIYFTKTSPSASFFLLHTRFWELAVGSLCAIYFTNIALNKVYKEILSFIGLIFILISIFTFNKHLVFPGYHALLPVLGTALILISAQNTTVGKFLSHKLMVFFGLISYSLYLWHWPLIVFSRDTYTIDLNFHPAIIFIISIGMAWLSYKYIETPFRNRTKFTPIKIFKLSFQTYFIILLLCLGTFYLSKNWHTRFDTKTQKLFATQQDISPLRNQCHFNKDIPKPDQYCVLGSSQHPKTILWGDSHGTELGYALSLYTSLYSVTYSSCSPNINYDYPYRIHCKDHNKQVFDFIIQNKNIQNVIITARYDNKAAEELIKYKANLDDQIQILHANGKHIIIMNEIPTPYFNIPQHLAKTKDLNETFTYRPKVFQHFKLPSYATVVKYEDILCQSNQCPLYINNSSLLFDDQHLTVGSAKIAAKYITDHILK